MSIRLDLLKKTHPFKILPNEVLVGVSEVLQEKKFTKDTLAYKQEETEMTSVDLILEGEYQTFFFDSNEKKRAIEIHGPNYCFGGISVLLNRKKALKSVIAKKGTVIYSLPKKDFLDLCNSSDEFFQFFTADFGNKMLNEEFAHFVKKPVSFEESYIASDQFFSRKINNITYNQIVSCTQDTPIYLAAQKMSERKVSCLFITDNQNKIIGFVTDITLRDNVIAKCLDPKNEINSIMDKSIVSINCEAYLYDAILLMFRTKTKYILIEENNDFIGFLSRNRLLGEQAQSPMVFIQSVKSAVTIEELRKKWQRVPSIVHQLLSRGVHAEIANQVITTVADTIALKVIEKVISEMGEPPAKFVFMVLGSEGRKEQTLKTDQDNAIIYEDKANEQRELVRDYFLEFASRVSDHLNNTGFVYCVGGYMASNPQWTHSLSHWQRNYKKWMEESDADNAMKFTAFFDCRYLYGDRTIIHQLKEFLEEELKKPIERFFMHIAKNALQYEPPLTFFRTIRTQTIDDSEVFDIKNSMTPIVDLVRVYALQNRVYEENTGERLKILTEKKVFTETQSHELMQSYYYLMGLRLKNQAKQIIINKSEPNNYIPINQLTKIELATLKEIFKTIQNFQAGIKMRFTNNLLG